MRINHNIASLNTHRQLVGNNEGAGKSLEKLSSGFRINRAGDDAAGLAISEKMRAQIRGLDQAQRNSQDGISLIQTSEGALAETHSILQRMRELAVQSSNGTYKNEVDRENINKEVERLKEEVDRISSSTNFNGIKLLDGSLSKDGSMKVGGNVLGLAKVVGGLNTVAATAFKLSGATTDSGTGAVDITGDNTAALNNVKFRFELGSKDQDPTAHVDSAKGEIVIKLSADQTKNVQAALETAIGDAIKGSDLVYTPDAGTTYYYKSTGDVFDDTGADFTFTGFDALTLAADDIIKQEQIDELNASLTYQNGNKAVTGQAGYAQTFQVGDKVGNTLDISFAQMEDADGNEINNFLNDYSFRIVAGNESYIKASVDEHKKVITVALSTVQANNIDTNIETALKGLVVNGQTLDDSNVDFTVTGAGDLDGTASPIVGLDTSKFVGADAGAKDGLTFQIGAQGVADQRVTLNVEDMSSAGLKIDAISVGSAASASKAIATIDNAINSVSGTRADLGALQNRLEHTISNLGTTSENLTASESRIRDVDMAKEMMEFTKNNILMQAAQAMLAQANQQPQGVLQLLR